MKKMSNKSNKAKLKPQLLVEYVTEVLSENILEGNIKGGEKLVETDLQKEFSTSRSPIREAFRKLEKEGLVEVIPRKGSFVRFITRKDIKENFPVRSILEGLAARLAYQNMNKDVLEDLRSTLDQMMQAVKDKNRKLYWEYHVSFHEIFIKATGNILLINLLKSLRMHAMWYKLSYRYSSEDLAKSLEIHQRIFDLFQNTDSDVQEIENVVREHIEVAMEKFISYIERHNDNERQLQSD